MSRRLKTGSSQSTTAAFRLPDAGSATVALGDYVSVGWLSENKVGEPDELQIKRVYGPMFDRRVNHLVVKVSLTKMGSAGHQQPRRKMSQ